MTWRILADGAAGAPEFVAHTPNDDGEWHELVDHLPSVGQLAAAFAERFGAAEWARLAGVWHDLGKANPAFRDYLVAYEGRMVTSPGHSAAGAALAAVAGLEPLAFAIAGHHAGLPSKARLTCRLAEAAENRGVGEARALLAGHPALLPPTDVGSTVPPMLRWV